VKCENFCWATACAKHEFRDAKEECSVCLEKVGREVKFPAHECTHWFCPACTSALLYREEWRFHLSPVPFGCPPCPAGCEKPLQGMQEACYQCSALYENWIKEDPEAYNFYQALERAEIDRGFEQSQFGSQKCPLCKKKVNYRT